MSGNYEERDLLKVLPVQYVGGGQFDLDTGRDQRRYDFTASAIYVGAAPAGAATSAASWTIKKIGLDAGGNPTYSQSTNIRSAVWNNRATETYS